MATAVLFGDSNIWGYVPGSNWERFPRDTRWPGRLAARLGESWEVVAEGLNGRTATMDNPYAEGRNGLPYLVPCLLSHAPVDLLVIMLGTNDLAERYRLSEIEVARCVGRLVRAARASGAGPSFGAPEILVICPPPFQGRKLGPAFAEVCARLDCRLLDLEGLVEFSLKDEEHFDAASHAAIAELVAAEVRMRFPQAPLPV